MPPEKRRGVAFITGASRGIGKECAVAFARAGYDCVITARTVQEGQKHSYGTQMTETETSLPGSLNTTAALIRKEGRRVLPIAMDLLDQVSVQRACRIVHQEWGQVDVLVNNAIYQGAGTQSWIRDLTTQNMHKILQANVLSPLLLVQDILPTMLQNGRGSIINVVSGSAMMDPSAPAGQGGWGFGYASSKAALSRMCGILAVEHRNTGIHFFNLEPGFVITELMRKENAIGDFVGEYGSTPPSVAAAVAVWLSTSPESKSWNGRLVFAPKLCSDLALVNGWSWKDKNELAQRRSKGKGAKL